VCAFHKQSFYFVGNDIPCRVEHTHIRLKRDGLVCKIAPAMDRRIEIDVGEKGVDCLIGTKQ
jgi:hypothetical protein